MNKTLKVLVELIDERGKIYKGTLDREVKPIQPDEALVPTNYITQFEKQLSKGFESPPGVYTVQYADGTPERKVRVLSGGKLIDAAAKAAGK